MGAEGLEPSRPYDQQILNLLRLPFRHAPNIAILLKPHQTFDRLLQDDFVFIA